MGSERGGCRRFVGGGGVRCGVVGTYQMSYYLLYASLLQDEV
jgi:hypothetical protein